MPNPLQIDPSRTVTLRKQFVNEMRARFKALAKVVDDLIVVDDAFGLTLPNNPTILQQVDRQAWRFLSSSQKVTSYRSWLQQQIDAKILSVDSITTKPWTATYIDSAYRKGLVRSYVDANKIGAVEGSDFYKGGQRQFLLDAFSAPETLSKLELLGTRAFNELKGVSDVMSQQLSRLLASGIANGEGPIKISRDMRKAIGALSKTRADVIARTEIIHAHAEGQLDSMERLGIDGVMEMAEWSTAGDDLVCELCGELEGVVMTIAEARGLLPRHPNCRCAWIPVSTRLPKEKGQLWRGAKDQAIADSIGHERVRGTFESVRKKSVWAGKDVLKPGVVGKLRPAARR